MRVLMIFLLSLTLALPAVGQVREAPSDPDFYYPYDPHNLSPHEPDPWARPNPDLSLRPKPRNSRNLSGVFAPDPVGVLRMIGVKESTSTCIGEPVSSLCAMETWMAGGIRRDDKLLAISSGPFWAGPFYATLSMGPPPPEKYTVYRVHEVYVAGPTAQWQKSKWWRLERAGGWYPRWRVGDVLIDVLILSCRSERPRYCNSHLVPVTYAVRRLPNGNWAVVDIFSPKY